MPCVLLAFGMGWLPAHFISGYHFDLHHDGLILFQASSYQQGLIPYKDFFIQHGLISIQLHAIVFKLFGEQLLYLREFTAICYGVLTTLTYLIARKITTNRWSLLAVFSWAGSAYYLSKPLQFYIHSWSSVYALIFILLIVLIYVSKEILNWPYLIFIGVLAALSGFCKINYGIVALLISGLIIIAYCQFSKCARKIYIQKFGLVLLGFTVVTLYYLYTLYVDDAITSFFNQQIKYAYAFSTENNEKNNLIKKFFDAVLSAKNGHDGVRYLTYLFEYVTIISLIWQIYKKPRSLKEVKLMTVGGVGLLCVLMYFPTPSLMHIYLAGPFLHIYVIGLMNYQLLNKTMLATLISIYIICEVLYGHVYKFINTKLPIYLKYELSTNLPYLKDIKFSTELNNQLNIFSKEFIGGNAVDIKCYLNNTQQPYYSAAFQAREPLYGKVMPFNWGYVSKIISPDMNAICQNEKYIAMVSAFPYLLDQHYLRYQFDVVKGQDMSTPVTYYTHSKQSDKINKIKSEVSVDTTSKIFDKRNNLIVQTANYFETYALKFMIEDLKTDASKKVTGLYVELLDQPFLPGQLIIDQINALELNRVRMYSTVASAPTELLSVYLNDKQISNQYITDHGFNINHRFEKLSLVLKNIVIKDDIFLYYKIRIQYDDFSMSEGVGSVRMNTFE